MQTVERAKALETVCLLQEAQTPGRHPASGGRMESSYEGRQTGDPLGRDRGEEVGMHPMWTLFCRLRPIRSRDLTNPSYILYTPARSKVQKRRCIGQSGEHCMLQQAADVKERGRRLTASDASGVLPCPLCLASIGGVVPQNFAYLAGSWSRNAAYGSRRSGRSYCGC